MGDICINIHIQSTFADTSPFVDFFYLLAGKAASIPKANRHISKCALNIYIYDDAYVCTYLYIYIYNIFLWNPYHPNHPNHPIAKYKPESAGGWPWDNLEGL